MHNRIMRHITRMYEK